VAPVPALATLVLGALPIAEFGSAAQRSRLLPGVVNGDLILTAALQEEGSDDPARPATTARRQGSGWQLDGVKICVPAAHVAERVLVPARSGDAAVGVFLVDPRADGVELAPQKTTNREPHFQLTLSGVAVAGDDVLGDPARGAERVQWLTERATAAYCAVQLGVSEKALRMTAEYTSTRKQFNRPVGSFQAVHTRAGDAYIHVEGMRLTTAPSGAWTRGCPPKTTSPWPSSGRRKEASSSGTRPSTCTAGSGWTSTTPCTATTCGPSRSNSRSARRASSWRESAPAWHGNP
jgi:alkylation response protein AidB-like acyl-CoA dehydrogenase